MTHLLTDELCEKIAPMCQWSGDIGDVVFRHSDMRVAYNVGEIKGRGDMVLKVIDWLKDNLGMLIVSTESELGGRYLESLKDEFIQSFVEEIYPLHPIREEDS